MSARKASKASSKRLVREYITAIAFFLPFFALFVTFTILPVAMAIGFSFTTYSVVQAPVWIGVANYQRMFIEDDTFIIALQNTFSFAVISGVIGYFLSFVVAWMIDNVKGRMFFALAFYAPSITGSIAMSVIWLTFFSPDSYGWINNALLQLNIIDVPLLWNQNPDLILPMVCIVSVWMSMGTGFLSFLAGFQNLNKEISEAGLIDGVGNKFQELIYIIMPQMKPMMLFGAVNAVTAAFAVYDIPFAMAGSPGPENAALTLVGHINDYMFTRLDNGYASTIAVFLFAITFLISRILFRVLTDHERPPRRKRSLPKGDATL